MSKDKWDEKPNDPNSRTMETLAWKLLKNADDDGFNPYPDAKRFTSGAGAGWDDDFWMDGIQGSGGTGYNANWEHMTMSPVPTVVRAARIPYLVSRPGKAGRHYLDHIVVGITDDMGAGPANPQIADWQIDGDERYRNLRRLGRFLLEELWKTADFGTLQRVRTWHQQDNGTNHGYSLSGPYSTQPKLWKFRNADRQIDASARITLVGVTSAGNRLRYLLVGYEGGGAW